MNQSQQQQQQQHVNSKKCWNNKMIFQDAKASVVLSHVSWLITVYLLLVTSTMRLFFSIREKTYLGNLFSQNFFYNRWNLRRLKAFGSWIQDGKIESNMLYNAHYFSCKYWTVALFSRAFPFVCLSCQFKRNIDSYEIPPPPLLFIIENTCS